MHQQEMLKGNTETLLLALLENEAMYGYQIVKEVDQRSSGYFAFKEGTLYPALRRLERDGLLEGKWRASPTGQDRRYYHVTAKGHARLQSMLEEWNLFTKAVNLVAQSDGVARLRRT